MPRGRGISPIVAVLLLVAITIAAALVTYFFALGFIGSSTATSSGAAAKLSIESATYSVGFEYLDESQSCTCLARDPSGDSSIACLDVEELYAWYDGERLVVRFDLCAPIVEQPSDGDWDDRYLYYAYLDANDNGSYDWGVDYAVFYSIYESGWDAWESVEVWRGGTCYFYWSGGGSAGGVSGLYEGGEDFDYIKIIVGFDPSTPYWQSDSYRKELRSFVESRSELRVFCQTMHYDQEGGAWTTYDDVPDWGGVSPIPWMRMPVDYLVVYVRNVGAVAAQISDVYVRSGEGSEEHLGIDQLGFSKAEISPGEVAQVAIHPRTFGLSPHGRYQVTVVCRDGSVASSSIMLR